MISKLPLTFVTIVETGSITLAADRLGLAKSAVSQNLKRLEAQLGVKLAIRTTRKFSPTPVGERYYSRCKEILALSRLTFAELEEFGAVPSGRIAITAPHAMISPLVAPAISKMISRFPLLRPMVIADDERLDIIKEGLDISITVGDLVDSNLKAKKIGVMKDILCVSSDLLSQSQLINMGQDIAQIQSLPYIGHIREPATVRHVLKNSESNETLNIDFRQTIRSNSIESLSAFVRQGLGVAMLPEYSVNNDLKEGKIVQLLPHYSAPEKPVYAVHAYENMPPKSVVQLILTIQQELQSVS